MRPAPRAENVTTFICQLRRNFGTLNFLEPQRPVQASNGIVLSLASKQSVGFTEWISIELALAQKHETAIHTEFHQDRSRNIEITGVNLLTPVSNVCRCFYFHETPPLLTTSEKYGYAELNKNATECVVPDIRLQTDKSIFHIRRSFRSKKNAY